jgi:hypothetical protein
MAERIDVMISSTALDLPDYREQAIDAILRMGMHPIAMEHLAAMSADAIDASLAMVDEAEIYLGIFAHRYGYMPDNPRNPDKLSVTELEYRRAVERDIPRLIFIIDENAPVSGADLEKNPDGAAKLLRLKDELLKNYVVKFFENPDQFREHAITALSAYRQRDTTGAMHYVSDIPKPPEPYIAHPYTLLQTAQLAGRQKEMNLLTDWVAKPDSEVYKARILNIVAIGGMGKSALTWKWFNEVAPQEMKPMAGALWWSFYESDARWENFIIRALAYVTGRSRQDIEENTNPIERENTLLRELNDKPYLLVLDGLERILVAYARMDAAYLADDELDEQTANRVAGALGLPDSAGQSFVGQHLLRKTADPRAGNFLRKLASVKASRILVSTRLYPADLQTVTGGTLPGSFAYFLLGLDDDSALELWRALGVSGSRDTLLPMFQRFDNYPLLIRALAGEVARFRRAPGDFDVWKTATPDFDPFKVELVNVKSHVLYHALQGLDEKAMKVLHTVAAFRMPASYETLVALLIGVDKAFLKENEFDELLFELEDRGLIGWDRNANRYDLHPIVRNVIWSLVTNQTKQGIHNALLDYFQFEKSDREVRIDKLEDLTPSIELYNSLISLGKYKEAKDFFFSRLWRELYYKLGEVRQQSALLELLFPMGIEKSLEDTDSGFEAKILLELSLAYAINGEPKRAAKFLAKSLNLRQKDYDTLVRSLRHLANTLRLCGDLYLAERNLYQGLKIYTDYHGYDSIVDLGWLTLLDEIRGIGSIKITQKMLKTVKRDFREFFYSIFAQAALWRKSYELANKYTNEAFKIETRRQKKHGKRHKRDLTRLLRLHGMAAYGVNDHLQADQYLYNAVSHARSANLIEEEMYSLVAIAELERRRGNLPLAREHLADTWEMCERAPYRLIHADGMNILAQIERDAGNTDAAITAATKAYELAWCDGISEDGKHRYAYWWGLKDAEKHLTELGAPIPKLPPFDPAAHEPLPEIDWDALLKPDTDDDSSP